LRLETLQSGTNARNTHACGYFWLPCILIYWSSREIDLPLSTNRGIQLKRVLVFPVHSIDLVIMEVLASLEGCCFCRTPLHSANQPALLPCHHYAICLSCQSQFQGNLTCPLCSQHFNSLPADPDLAQWQANLQLIGSVPNPGDLCHQQVQFFMQWRAGEVAAIPRLALDQWLPEAVPYREENTQAGYGNWEGQGLVGPGEVESLASQGKGQTCRIDLGQLEIRNLGTGDSGVWSCGYCGQSGNQRQRCALCNRVNFQSVLGEAFPEDLLGILEGGKRASDLSKLELGQDWREPWQCGFCKQGGNTAERCVGCNRVNFQTIVADPITDDLLALFTADTPLQREEETPAEVPPVPEERTELLLKDLIELEVRRVGELTGENWECGNCRKTDNQGVRCRTCNQVNFQAVSTLCIPEEVLTTLESQLSEPLVSTPPPVSPSPQSPCIVAEKCEPVRDVAGLEMRRVGEFEGQIWHCDLCGKDGNQSAKCTTCHHVNFQTARLSSLSAELREAPKEISPSDQPPAFPPPTTPPADDHSSWLDLSSPQHSDPESPLPNSAKHSDSSDLPPPPAAYEVDQLDFPKLKVRRVGGESSAAWLCWFCGQAGKHAFKCELCQKVNFQSGHFRAIPGSFQAALEASISPDSIELSEKERKHSTPLSSTAANPRSLKLEGRKPPAQVLSSAFGRAEPTALVTGRERFSAQDRREEEAKNPAPEQISVVHIPPGSPQYPQNSSSQHAEVRQNGPRRYFCPLCALI